MTNYTRFQPVKPSSLRCEISTVRSSLGYCDKQARWWVMQGGVCVCGEHKRLLEQEATA